MDRATRQPKMDIEWVFDGELPWDLDAVFAVSTGYPVYCQYRCGHWLLSASKAPGPVYQPAPTFRVCLDCREKREKRCET